MLEFVLAGQGTIMVKKEVACVDIYRVTGWSFTQDEAGIVLVKGNETHAGVNGKHEIFRDTKSLSNIDAVLDLLLQEGKPVPSAIEELLTALRDAIKAHRSLYLKGNILHRDISENNIIITNPGETGFAGMLIDLDLAKVLGSGRSGARHQTGTMEFMAIEVLLGIDHTYRALPQQLKPS